MINLQKSDLGLSAININSSVELFDGSQAVSGNHLRWNFNPEMGFPKNGFTIQRYNFKITSNRNNVTKGNSFIAPASLLEWEKKINLPRNKREALSRINEVLVSNYAKIKYNQAAEELMDIIGLLYNTGNPEEMYNTRLDSSDTQENGLKSGLRVIDVLMAASVDPYIARMLGLYIIDTSAKPTLKYVYLIQGHWDDMQFAPLSLSFENYNIDHSVLPIQFQNVKVVPNQRTVGVSLRENNDLYRTHLLVLGNLNQGFSIKFDFPIEEVVIEYELNNNSGNWEFTTLGEPLLYTDNGNLIRIARPNVAFQDLTFKNIPGETFRIYNINYRKQYGTIGNITNIAILDPSFSKVLSRPNITKLNSEQMPAILNNSGEVSNKISQVKISSLASVPNINEILIPKESDSIKVLKSLDNHNNPVRIQFSRLTKANSRLVSTNQLKKIGSPAIYRENTSNINLPNLLGYWSFNGNIVNIKDGVKPTKIGTPQFIKSKNEDKTAPFYLKFNKGDALIIEQEYIKSLGDNFTLQATVKISELSASTATIIGNSKRNGFWWGIKKESEAIYKMQLYINGNLAESNFSIPTNYKLQLSVSYDGRKAIFRYSGLHFLNFDEPINLEQGKVNIPRTNITIGADVSTSGVIRSSFAGEIAELSIWQQVIHPSESNHLLEKAVIYLPQQQDLSQLIFHDPKTYFTYSGSNQIAFKKTNALKSLASSFSVFLWARPNSNISEGHPALLGNNYQNGFWLGLVKSGNQFHLRFWMNNRYFDTRNKINVEKWSHLGVSYNGNKISLFVNGRLDSTHNARLDALVNNDENIAIGSEILPLGETDVKFPFNGLITDIQIWRVSLTIAQWQQKMGGLQFTNKFLENAHYHYGAQAIDIFGRISRFSSVKKIKTKAKPSYNSPVNLHAKFKPISGEILSKEDILETDTDGNQIKVGYVIVTNIPFKSILKEKILGYDLTVKKTITYEVPKKSESDASVIVLQQEERIVEQSFEINKAIKDQNSLNFKFEVNTVPFEQLIPEVGDRFYIELDFFYTLKWGWTGIQQLYFKEINAFELYQSRGIQNELSSSITVLEKTPVRNFGPKEFKIKINKNTIGFLANELNNQYCLIGAHKFKIINHTQGSAPEFKVKYTSEPLISPENGDTIRITIPEGATGYKKIEDNIDPLLATIPIPEIEPLIISQALNFNLEVMEAVSELELDSNSEPLVIERKNLIQEQKIDWFPLSKVYKMTLSGVSRPIEDAIENNIKDYIPGALVFYDTSENQNKWRSFYIIWHQWTSVNRLIIYTTPGEKEEPISLIDISREHTIRFYIGKSYSYDGVLNRLPNFINGQTTEQYHLMLKSKDEEGVTSDVSRSTVMVAVNRKRPEKAPKPNVVPLTKADYYGKSIIQVDWNHFRASEPLYYKVFRVTDSDIYTRDLEQRRTRQGFYKNLSPNQVFQDDVDFMDWLQTQDNITPADLFADLHSEAWQNVTSIWRRWADRFYPALIEDELLVLAERRGNEKAFKLLTGKPIRATSYQDEVNGIVSNRYFYRLKTMSEALSESTIWGAVSNGVITEAVKAPRTPVFTKVEAGDRQISLQWSLNRESDFKEYILYRSEQKEDLEDLRWWSTEADGRIVADIPDPRITTSNNSIEIPNTNSMARVLAVYRISEFKKDNNPIELQPQALNYYTNSSEFETSDSESLPHVISNLRKIENGVAVAIVYEDESGHKNSLLEKHQLLPHLDDGILGLQDYYYRLVAKNENQLLSKGSEIRHARTLEVEAPPAPELISSSRISKRHFDLVDLEIMVENNLEIMIESRSDNDLFWKVEKVWTSEKYPYNFRQKVSKNELKDYRLWSRTLNQLQCSKPLFINLNIES